ncbi:hypothetical protein TrST_g8773 [Triparma strigata]|uniref:BCNT-C domain-containing protein n=1 Tax=Triparma strigata TaxID=1606541 RepID=A0A9W7EAS4_9STRA|nr:hypothetical protein TrST_g8773 [Triparma strigata]
MSNPADSDTDPEDEDYVLEPTSEDDEIKTTSLVQEKPQGISDTNRSKVDDLWSEMNGLSSTSSSTAGATGLQKKKSKKSSKDGSEKVSKKSKAQSKILKQMFGSTIASTLTSSSHINPLKKSKLPSTSFSLPSKKIEKITRRFAGKDITVTRTILSTSPPPTSSVDAVLSTLKGPQKLTTIGKTAIDWDNMKESSGLSSDIEKGAEKGFLDRKDFLNRVDGRRFEIEKEEREKKRNKRGR